MLNTAVSPGKGDILLLADASWCDPDLWPTAARSRSAGCVVATIIYDLIPLTHPEFFVDTLVHEFESWYSNAKRYSDLFICISRTTMNTVADRLSPTEIRPGLSFFYLGSDITQRKPSTVAATRVMPNFPSLLTFIVVGTLEPRKNIGLILDAFEQLWNQGRDINLVLVGHHTWKQDALLVRIKHSPQLNKRLYWVRNVTDQGLQAAYALSEALIIASKAEGFGLPIVEAFQRGLPVICSDIPVFRELAEGKAHFFNPDRPDDLARVIDAYLDSQVVRERPRPVIPWLSWKDSAKQMADTLAELYRVHNPDNTPLGSAPSLRSDLAEDNARA